MIYWDKLREFLKEKTGLGYYNSEKSELICRCPHCDKNSRKNHGHLYILVPDDINELPVFNCFKCGPKSSFKKGTLIKLIRFFGENPSKFISDEILRNKNVLKSYNYYKKQFDINKLRMPEQTNEDDKNRYIMKRRYLQGRLGFEYNLDRIPNVIYDIKEFININGIDLGSKYRFLDYYDGSYIGFISTRGTKLLLRNIDNNSDYRWIKIPLINDRNFFNDFYALRTGYLKNKTSTIVLCEGIFDLLNSIDSYELQKIKQESCLWVAILGSGFHKIVSAVLDYCKLTASNFVILSDTDKKKSYYKYFKNNPSVIGLNVYWNKGKDDFGQFPINPVRIVM